MRIVATDLTKRYGTGENQVIALHKANLEIQARDFISIVGPSGSGKSTLLHLISGLDYPTEGVVEYDGQNIHQGKDAVLSAFRRRRIGFIFQKFHLIPVLTARENIIMPLLLDHRQVDEGYFKQITQFLGLEHRLTHLPSELSGGQQQRVAIARALIAKPDVIFADEPTGNLDSQSGREVMDLLASVHREFGKTIVVITHEMKVIQEICNRVAIISEGKIAEMGSVQEIFRAPKTQIGQELVFHEGSNREAYAGRLPYCYRVVFKGGISNEPVLGRMMIDCNGVANILAGNTRNIDGEVFGQMILQFPEDEALRKKMIQYLLDQGVEVEEVAYV